MNVTTHLRPGVYSAYDASSVVSGKLNGGLVGLAARVPTASDHAVQTFSNYEQAADAFGPASGENLSELIRLALLNGASAVACAPVSDQNPYQNAFHALANLEPISVLLCDSTELSVQQTMRDSALQASAARRERLALAAGAASESVSALVQRAGSLNSERVVLVAPAALDQNGNTLSGLCAAAAVAGVLASENDPAIPLGGAELLGLYGLERSYEENELDLLIAGGVTPLERLNGTFSVVRGVTTRTKSGSSPDSTWRDLSTIRVADHVISNLRAALRAKFRRAKNTPQSRGAIRAQVILELENNLRQEIITAYDNVAVTADAQDPTRCLVAFSFTVAHGLNQIWLTAHITV